MICASIYLYIPAPGKDHKSHHRWSAGKSSTQKCRMLGDMLVSLEGNHPIKGDSSQFALKNP